jgi:cell division protein FtsQ
VSDPVVQETLPPRPSGRWKLIALIVLLLLVAPASWLARRGASKMDFFRLRSVAIEGTRYLSPDAVLEQLRVDTTRSVWDDTGPLVERLQRMPQIAGVDIDRRLPGTLVVKIRENLPVALAPSPRGLEPVDSSGIVLPIDPSQTDMDLPAATQRDRAILSLLTDTRAGNPMLYRRISEVARDGKDAIVMKLAPLDGKSAVIPGSMSADSAAHSQAVLRVRVRVGVSVGRLADIFPVESDLMRRRANVAELDLRYRDQVIARLQ